MGWLDVDGFFFDNECLLYCIYVFVFEIDV